jgi:HTH-type transcriptional regulator, transcriptional repressor of NAD biosynthesis genes
LKRGLVIGKFMPIHQGHIALINFAVDQCDELIVSMSYTSSDPIPSDVRFEWIKEIFRHQPKIKPAKVNDDFDDDTLQLEERTEIWSDFIRSTYPPIHLVFSSEEYGEPFAKHLQAKHIAFDYDRNRYPVSATRIRERPCKYWDFIPVIAHPYFVKKICFYGPESTGKSTLAKTMAEMYSTEFVPEVARELIISNDFTVDDIVKIGYAQLERVEAKTKKANKLLFCDTDAITTEIYSRHYLGVIPEILFELERKVHYDIYFLMDIDVDWVPDGLRDLADQREKMFAIFKDELTVRKIPYILVRGTHAEREKFVKRIIDQILS